VSFFPGKSRRSSRLDTQGNASLTSVEVLKKSIGARAGPVFGLCLARQAVGRKGEEHPDGAGALWTRRVPSRLGGHEGEFSSSRIGEAAQTP
jgi:hypothetical protein